jgi:hypothetical protein
MPLKRAPARTMVSAFDDELRLVSTQENYPWIGTDKKMFLCVKVISPNPELTRQRKTFLSVP